jgi:hypothetical protein
MSTTTTKTIIIAITGGSAMNTLARRSCHMGNGAIRRSWKPRLSLGTDGEARAEDMNIARNVTRATFDQNPLRLRPGWLSATA